MVKREQVIVSCVNDTIPEHERQSRMKSRKQELITAGQVTNLTHHR